MPGPATGKQIRKIKHSLPLRSPLLKGKANRAAPHMDFSTHIHVHAHPVQLSLESVAPQVSEHSSCFALDGPTV